MGNAVQTRNTRSVIYIDMAYTYEIMKSKGHDEFYQARHSRGYFDKVWGVHPVADVAGKKSSKIEIFQFSSNQVIVEGVAMSGGWPRILAPLNFFYSQVRLARLLSRLIRENGISLIVSTDPFYSGCLGLCLKRMCGLPLIVCAYANYDLAYRTDRSLAMPRLIPSKRLQDMVARAVLSRADLVVAANLNHLDWTLLHGANAETAVTLPVAKVMQECHLKAPSERSNVQPIFRMFDIPLGRKYLLAVGRLLKVKLAEEAVRAMIMAAQQDLGIVGIVAGEGPLRQQLEEEVAAVGLQDNIFFLGNVSQEILSTIIPHCITVSALTGMALIECGLGGSPVVAYDADWQAEFVEDGVTGYVVPCHNYAMMAERAVFLLQNPRIRAAFSAAMRKHAVAFADPRKLADKEHAAFNYLLAGTPLVS